MCPAPTNLTPPGITCDIFCRVIDNFGDIGVTWRLALQLALEHGVKVRLIVDDLASFSRIEPTIDLSCGLQEIRGISVISWNQAFDIDPADFVIEAFAVNLPASYVAAMAAMVCPPVWINLEYLSAESWVGEHHLLPSPHPKLPLTKHFFFPGFTQDSGGILRERYLLAERDAFMSANEGKYLRVFLFGYRNDAGDSLVRSIDESTMRGRCTVPEGALASALTPNVAIETINFTSQKNFDRLLWQHDVLFVRGEDSFIRAQWAAKPFIWQIYPQNENAHWVKLNSFLALYCVGLETVAASVLRELWRAWNAEDRANIGAAWQQFTNHLPAFQAHAKAWSERLAQMPDLAANLLSFYQKSTKI